MIYLRALFGSMLFLKYHYFQNQDVIVAGFTWHFGQINYLESCRFTPS